MPIGNSTAVACADSREASANRMSPEKTEGNGKDMQDPRGEAQNRRADQASVDKETARHSNDCRRTELSIVGIVTEDQKRDSRGNGKYKIQEEAKRLARK